MKRGKSLKRDFKKAASAYGLNWKDWLVIDESEFYITIQKKSDRSTKRIDKYAREKGVR